MFGLCVFFLHMAAPPPTVFFLFLLARVGAPQEEQPRFQSAVGRWGPPGSAPGIGNTWAGV